MRLTKRDAGGNAVMDCDNCEIKYRESCCSLYQCRNALIAKLAAYEDTGYSPREIKSLEGEWDAMRKVVDSYRDAEDHGLLIRLPCKVGTPIWSSVMCRIDENGEEHPAQWPFMISMMDEWGTGFFLTREEAEAAMKGETEDV